jgi:amino acid adenylation domain-containing protein
MPVITQPVKWSLEELGVSMPSDQCLHHLFEARAQAFPSRTAVSAPDRDLTYQELNDRADSMARRLVAAGVRRGSLVGLCMDRSAEMISGLLAILKAGAAYLPLDPAYPKQRIEYLLADSGASVVLAAPAAAAVLDSTAAAVIWAGEADADGGHATAAAVPGPGATGADAAYAIYTSGSTGQPKGVVVEHRNVIELFEQAQPLFGFSEHDVWTLFHSISFDFSVWEVFGALRYGGRLVIVPADVTQSPLRFLELLAAQRVTVLNQTPSAFWQLAAADASDRPSRDLSLRLVIFGGERLEPKLLEPWVSERGDERPALYNMYGITETAVHVTSRRIRRADVANPGVSPIGTPLPGTRVALRDSGARPVPDGEPGEIFVAGPGVARGYLNRPALTAERFLTSAEDGIRWYRSGDRAVQTADGLIYLGRLDDQLKVRGFRIEPAEVEARLAAYPGVATAVVTAQDLGDGDIRLIAHVVPAAGAPQAAAPAQDLAAALADWARAALPAHMCPSAYRVMAELPVTTSGKVDRDALAGLGPLEPPAPATGGPAAAPARRTPTEQIIAEIVQGLVEAGPIGLDDDLFDSGVTSLTFMRILTQINLRFQVAVTGAELDEATVNRLALCVDSQIA